MTHTYMYITLERTSSLSHNPQNAMWRTSRTEAELTFPSQGTW